MMRSVPPVDVARLVGGILRRPGPAPATSPRSARASCSFSWP